MQRLTFEILQRDFTSPDPALPMLEVQVERYSTKAFGGPYEAVITARGDMMALWELLETLRCPVQIRAEEGDVLWWGYISAFDIVTVNPFAQNNLPVQVSASLETMFNRVAVAYNPDNGSGSLGERQTTAWNDDYHSQGIYGIKELLASGGDLNGQYIAENGRDTLLAQKRLPITEITFRQNLPSRATIRCFGWWQSLAWRYSAYSSEDVVDTATQIERLCRTYGQFFTSVNSDVISGIDTSEFRDTDATAMEVAESLMQAGTANHRRMLTYVDANRRVRIFEEPANTSPYFQHSDGKLYDKYGIPIRQAQAPSGQWVRLVDVIPPNINQEMLANPDYRFIETTEYDVKKDQLNLTYRDALDPFDIGVPIDG